MAIVKTIISGTAVVHIDDSCCAGVSKEEMARRWAEVDRVIWQINQNHARRMAEKEREAAAALKDLPSGAAGENPSDPASRATSPWRKRGNRRG